MTRRDKPDAGKSEHGPREVFYAGIAFHRTAQIMADYLEQTKDSDFMVSLYVNAALAAELFLKCLLVRAEHHREETSSRKYLWRDRNRSSRPFARRWRAATPT